MARHAEADSGNSILLLDDEPDMVRMLGEVLQWEHPEVTVHTTTDAGEALAFLEENGPVSLAVLDYRMPEHDGLQVASMIQERFPDQAVAILSAFPDPALRDAALAKAGVVAYIDKSLDAFGIVQNVLAAARLPLQADAAPVGSRADG